MTGPKPLAPNGAAFNQGIHEIRTSPITKVGMRGFLPDGRVFYYGHNTTAAALNVGQLYVSAAIETNHANQTVNAAGDLPLGATAVTVTVGATAVVENEYAEGYLCVTDGTGEAYYYKIRNHPSHAGSGTFTANLYDPIAVASAAATTTTLVQNLWRDPVIAPTSQARVPIGIPTFTIPVGSTTAQYGWIQTWGFVLGWCDENTAIGSLTTIGTGTAGQIEAYDLAAEPIVGMQVHSGVADEYQPMFLQIAP